MSVKLLTKPNEKAVFFTALFGVIAATLVLIAVPSPVPDLSGGDEVLVASATSRPASGPTSRPAISPSSRPASVDKAAGGLEDSYAPEEFPFDVYEELLDEYVVNKLVAYPRLATEGTGKLARLSHVISNTKPSALENAPKRAHDAWYINAYNIFTLKLIADHYPIDSIRDIDDPWDTKFKVAQQQVTLNDIEHKILRMKDSPENVRRKNVDPRLHFALNCASIGCPDLLPEPFTAEKLDQLYDRGVRSFVETPSKFRVEGDILYISKLLDWYGEDFELLYEDANKKEAIGRFFADYLNDESNAALLRNGDFDIEWLEYDWGLNESG